MSWTVTAEIVGVVGGIATLLALMLGPMFYLGTKIESFRKNMEDKFDKFRNEFENFRGEAWHGFADVKEEMHKGLNQVRSEMRTEITYLRSEMRTELNEFKKETKDFHGRMSTLEQKNRKADGKSR